MFEDLAKKGSPGIAVLDGEEAEEVAPDQLEDHPVEEEEDLGGQKDLGASRGESDAGSMDGGGEENRNNPRRKIGGGM